MNKTQSKEINDIIRDLVMKYILLISGKKAKFRRCFNCGEPFKLNRVDRFYCSNRCRCRAHYLAYKIKGNTNG